MTPPVSTPWTLTARWVFPVNGPPLAHGVVTIADDRILAVEAHRAGRADLDLGDVAVLPGLVNAHTHLDLSGMRNLAPPSPDFPGWLSRVIEHRRQRSASQISDDVKAGLAECLRTGTTLIGDISSGGDTWDALSAAPVRAVVFRELLGLPRERAHRAWADALNWLRAHPASETCRPGLSPHAPYSVRASLFRAIARLARERGLPIATHVAEAPDEVTLLSERRGGFVGFLSQLGVWAPEGLIGSHQELLDLFQNVRHGAFVHANYLSSRTSMARILCPRTRAAFGFVGGPITELLRPGVRVALGTDSLASNPDLDLLAEARFLRRQCPEVPGEVILRMATANGAEVLGWASETGTLEPGKSADLIVVPVSRESEGDPHELILGTDRPVASVLWRGRWR